MNVAKLRAMEGSTSRMADRTISDSELLRFPVQAGKRGMEIWLNNTDSQGAVEWNWTCSEVKRTTPHDAA